MNTAKTIGIILAGLTAGFLIAKSGQNSPAPPPAVVTPASAAPESAPATSDCGCGGDCVCSPECLCKEPGECNRPKAACTQCGGDGLLATGEYGDVLCPTCNKGRAADIPTFKAPELYAQPQPAPVAKPAAVQSYSSCANGSCSSSGGGRRRLFGRRP